MCLSNVQSPEVCVLTCEPGKAEDEIMNTTQQDCPQNLAEQQFLPPPYSPSLSSCPSPFSFFYEATSTVSTPGITLQKSGKLQQRRTRKIVRMFLLITVLLFGLASAQKVLYLDPCSINGNNLRIDCKYSLPAELPEPFCRFKQGERLLDTTFPDEEQHAPFRNRAKVRLFQGNVCRLLFKDLPAGKSNFTCNVQQGDSASALKTSVIDKKLLLPCTAWSVLLQSCSGLLLTLMTLPMLLEIHWL